MKTPITLTNEESEKLLYYLLWKNTGVKIPRKGHRDYTIGVLMLDAGLRVGEVARLMISDLLVCNEPVTNLHLTKSIARKGAVRYIPLSQRIRNAIDSMKVHYWSHADQYVKYYAFGSLNSSTPVSTRQIQRIIRIAAIKSIGHPIHPHILRHTFATNLMRVTSTRIVQELLGHKRLTSTQIYTHPNSQDLKDAIDKLK